MATNQTGSGGVNSLGTATGVIKIDVSSLKTAQVEVVAFAKATSAALGSLNVQLSSFAKIANAATAIRVAELRKEATEATAASRIEVAAIQAKAKADSDATKERLANLKLLQQQQQRQSGGGTGGTGAGGAGQEFRFPTFIQFAFYPLSSLLSAAGATGAAGRAMATGAALGLVDQLPLIGFQLGALSDRLKAMGGVIGSVASFAGNATAGLGGVASSLASVLAVVAPVILIGGGLIAVMNSVAQAFAEARQKAEDYVNKQLELNELAERGGTLEDVEKLLADARIRRDTAQTTLAQNQPIRDLLNNLSALQLQTVQGAAAGFGGSQAALAATRQVPGSYVTQLDQQAFQMSGGAFTTIEAFYAEWDRLQKEFADASGDVATYANAIGNADFALNSLQQAFNAVAGQAVDEAQMRQQIAQMSAQQLQKRLVDNQVETAALERNAALVTGKQQEAFLARLDYLDKERGAIQAMLALGVPLRELLEFIQKAGDLAANFNLQTERTQEDRAISAVDAVFDRVISQAREVEDFVRQRGQAVEDFNREQSRADEDYLRSRQKAEDDYREAQADAEAEHQDRLAKIIRDARIGILEAAARLDARAVFEQQRRRNQAIEDETEQATEAREQRQREYEEQLQEQEDQYQRQRERRIDDFNLQLQREDQERAIRAARAEQDYALQQYRQERNYALQDARRLEDHQRQIQGLISHYGIMQSIQNSGLALLRFGYQYFFGQVMSDMSGIGRGGTALPTRDAGGMGWAGQAYLIGRGAQPEIFIPRTSGSFIPNADQLGTTVNIESIVLGDIGERSDADVIALIDSGLRQFFHSGIQRGGRSA